ncbi:MAG: (2Fe-2S) ferredoxin domain-containing protein [Deltaproteobacteria bacterium]
MKPYSKHILLCTGKTCATKGSEDVLKRLRENIDEDGLKGIKTSKGGCFGVCKETEERGILCPVVVVYPEGIWYERVDTDNIDEILDKHIKKGKVVERLFHYKLEQ